MTRALVAPQIATGLRRFGRLPRVDDTDLQRQKRIGCRFVGGGIIAFTLAMTPVAIQHAELAATWWTPVSLLLVAVPTCLLVWSTFLPRPRLLETLAFACAAGYLLATLLWFPAWRGVPDEEARWAVWLLQFPSVPSFALVVVLRVREAWINVVVATFAVHIANQVARFGEIRPLDLLSAPLSIALAGVFIAIAIATARNVRVLDERQAEVMEITESLAAQTAHEAERARFAAIIHDRVIASLLAVTPGPSDPRLREQASSALRELDRRADTPTDMTGDELVDRAVETAASVSDEIRLSVSGDRTAGFPTEVVAAITDAAGEAMRNWQRHAGGDARCEVAVEMDDGTVTIIVSDDGVGFDPETVDPRRFGIASGIGERMAALPGASAEIRSSPGAGTVVRLNWNRP